MRSLIEYGSISYDSVGDCNKSKLDLIQD